MLILPVIGKSSVVPVENYSKICEVVTLTHLREFFRQLYSLLLHLKVQIVVCVITNRLSKAGQFIIETAAKRRPIERDKIPEDASPLVERQFLVECGKLSSIDVQYN